MRSVAEKGTRLSWGPSRLKPELTLPAVCREGTRAELQAESGKIRVHFWKSCRLTQSDLHPHLKAHTAVCCAISSATQALSGDLQES